MSTAVMLNPKFVTLPVKVQAEWMVWEEAMQDIDRAGNKAEACKGWVLRNGHLRGWKGWRTIQRKYYGWVRSGRSWEFLADKAKAPRLPPSRHTALASAFKCYCEKNQRVCSAGWKQMLRDLIRGVRIPGVGT